MGAADNLAEQRAPWLQAQLPKPRRQGAGGGGWGLEGGGGGVGGAGTFQNGNPGKMRQVAPLFVLFLFFLDPVCFH